MVHVILALVAIIAFVVAPIPTAIVLFIVACVMFPPLAAVIFIALVWWWVS